VAGPNGFVDARVWAKRLETEKMDMTGSFCMGLVVFFFLYVLREF
jgi:hypothetical protein